MVSGDPICLLGISGSPREAATSFVVKRGLEYAGENWEVKTEYLSLKDMTIKFCIHCDYCIREKKGCIHDDDMSGAYGKMEDADVFLVGTPVYYGSVSGQLKTFFDRCRAAVARDPDFFQDKVGAAVAVGGDRNGGQEPALLTIHSFYLINQMLPVSGGPFGANLGGTVWSRDRGREGAEGDQEGLNSIYKTVDSALELATHLRDK